MSFMAFRSAGAPYKAPTRRVGDLVAYPDSPTAYPGQGRIDFTPSGSELGHALRGRETRAQKILARLRQGPANSQEMMAVGGLRFGARILELRQAGHKITTEEHADHAVYSLEEA